MEAVTRPQAPRKAGRPPVAAQPARSRRPLALESVAALGACMLAAVPANWRLLRPDFVSADALVHQYWMVHWRDPQLFNDAITSELRHSARHPDGYQALFWVVSQVADPIAFGEWLGVGLTGLSGWLVFRIVREHTDWCPAAWIAAGLFLRFQRGPVEVYDIGCISQPGVAAGGPAPRHR
jgi:hypothetical protein